MDAMKFETMGALKMYAERSRIMYVIFCASHEDGRAFVDYFSESPTTPDESMIMIDRSANEMCLESLAYMPKGTFILAIADHALLSTCDSVESIPALRDECQEWIDEEYIE